MTCDDAAHDGSDADFQRWYFGGSPPESDCWPRHAFEDALHGHRAGSEEPVAAAPVERMPRKTETAPHFAMA